MNTRIKAMIRPGKCKPCPFCGGAVAEHPNPAWQKQYFVVYHRDACYFGDGDKAPFNFTLLPRNYEVRRWNTRNQNPITK